jgi:hypothetical protein
MIALPRGKPIHYLQNVRLWIWLLIGGGAAVFIGFVMALALLHPDTPANELITVAERLGAGDSGRHDGGRRLHERALVVLPEMRLAAADEGPDPRALPALQQRAARSLRERVLLHLPDGGAYAHIDPRTRPIARSCARTGR